MFLLQFIGIQRNVSDGYLIMQNVENEQNVQCESKFEETPSPKPKKSCSIQSFKSFTTAVVRWVNSPLIYLLLVTVTVSGLSHCKYIHIRY